MRKVWMALMLVAGCGAGDQEVENKTSEPVQTASLTGLYEGGDPKRPDQMCVVPGGGTSQFGLVIWGGNMHSCSGSGSVLQDGNQLTLTMAGDQSCTIEARIEEGVITFPQTMPEGCSYYCGARAVLDKATFAKKGGSEEDAMKAKDLVGEPLCAGLAPNQ